MLKQITMKMMLIGTILLALFTIALSTINNSDYLRLVNNINYNVEQQKLTEK